MIQFVKMLAGLFDRKNPSFYLGNNVNTFGLLYAGTNMQDAINIYNQIISKGIFLKGLYLLSEQEDEMEIPGIKIYHWSDLEREDNRPEAMYIVIREHCFGGIYKSLQNMGVQTYILPNRDLQACYENMIKQNIESLYEVYNNFNDVESKKTFCHYIEGRYSEQNKDFYCQNMAQYMVPEFMPVSGDIAIDGGAFDGETAKDFVSLGAKVYSFEMDEVNYRQCIKMAEKCGFIVENMGLSSCSEEHSYRSLSAGSSVMIPGDKVARFVDLDTYVREHDLPRVDYIKLDIEGSELEALHGAVNTIMKWKPKMAICVYHRPEDIFVLPQYIKSLRPDYELSFRHYSLDYAHCYTSSDLEKQKILQALGAELYVPFQFEAVLYCR